jgi:hypothetical protein
LFISFFNGNDRINAQEAIDSFVLPVLPAEKVNLLTDRSLYCVNDKILFSAEYASNEYIEDYPWSNVLYVELIKWNGNKIVQAKFPVKQNNISGFLDIPENLVSGNYYLRAYTNWMRNYTNASYSYSLVKIVNPFIPDVDNGPEEETNHPHTIEIIKDSINSINSVIFHSQNRKYKSGQRVNLEMILDDNYKLQSDHFCISVAKCGTIDTNRYALSRNTGAQNKQSAIKYLPEIRGPSVTGLVVDKTTQKPLEGIMVRLCIPVTGSYFSIYKTNDKGEFYFTLPMMFGKSDLFIDIDNDNSYEAEIIIDDDFCNETVNLPYIPFVIEKGEDELIRDIMINSQIDDIFLYDTEKKTALKENDNSAVFYGSAEKIYHTKDYIELPNLEEFFFDVVYEVLVDFNKDGNLLRISANTDRSLSPLVLVDNIPVCDIGEFLKTNLQKIERVEIISSKYIAGNAVFSGIISIYSGNKDFAGIDLNPAGIFFSYNLLTTGNYHFPDYKNNTMNSRIPDNRILLYWQPDITLSKNKKTAISFYTSHEKGDYMVFLRNTNSDNQTNYGTYTFKVE